jgi:hypothetical protein
LSEKGRLGFVMKKRIVAGSIFDWTVMFLVVVGSGIPIGLRLIGSLDRDIGLRRQAAASASQRQELLAPRPADPSGFPLHPWRVGVQAGHWKIEELPWELSRLRESTGARYGSFREVDANLEISRSLVKYLRAAGIQADLLPATVPPGYQADAFISIHADGAYRPGVRGWKISAPWRSSAASRMLRDSVARTYALLTGLPEDRYGTTYGMKGYYAFSPHRTRYAIAVTTPAIIIETGFVTVAEDRKILFGDPDVAARAIAAGVISFLSRHDPYDSSEMAVRRYPVMMVGKEEAELTFHPEEGDKVVARLEKGTLVRPVSRENGWVEVIVWRNYRRFGWLREADLEFPGG